MTLHIGIFMFKFHNQLLPIAFNTYFTTVDHIHKYNTRSAARKSYHLPRVRTNYGKFNIRFQGPKIWNSIAEHVKSPSLRQFKGPFTHAIFDAISDAISRTKRSLPYPARMLFSRSIAWIGKKVITYYL